MTNEIKRNFEEKIKDYEKLLETARKIFFGALVLFVTYIKGSPLIQALKEGSIQIAMILSFCLFVITLLLGLLWFFSTDHELRIFKRYMGIHLPETTLTPTILSYIIPIFIITLSSLSDKLLIYSFIYWLYLSFDIYGRALTTKNLLKALNNNKNEILSSHEKQITEAIYAYYIERPFETRGYLIGTITLFVFLSALIVHFGALPPATATKIEALGYLLMIAEIILGELVIWCWRYGFYKAVKSHEMAATLESLNVH